MDTETAIRHRRSHKVFGGQAIERATLRELIDLAIWAPNHKRTEPWRFAAVPGDRLAALVSTVAHLPGTDPKQQPKIEKLCEVLRTAGAVIAVSYARSPEDPARDREDYAACACAMQNLMLGAVSRGLVSYWSSTELWSHPDVLALLQVAPGELCIGALILGSEAVAMPAVRQKSADDVTRWV